MGFRSDGIQGSMVNVVGFGLSSCMNDESVDTFSHDGDEGESTLRGNRSTAQTADGVITTSH